MGSADNVTDLLAFAESCGDKALASQTTFIVSLCKVMKAAASAVGVLKAGIDFDTRLLNKEVVGTLGVLSSEECFHRFQNAVGLAERQRS